MRGLRAKLGNQKNGHNTGGDEEKVLGTNRGFSRQDAKDAKNRVLRSWRLGERILHFSVLSSEPLTLINKIENSHG